MSIKKISDATKIEALNETDALLVNRNGTLAQISGSEVGGKTAKPVCFLLDDSLPFVLASDDGTPATIDQVLDAMFGGGAYVRPANGSDGVDSKNVGRAVFSISALGYGVGINDKRFNPPVSVSDFYTKYMAYFA